MMRNALIVFIIFVSPAMAENSGRPMQALLECADKADTKERLACFDLEVSILKKTEEDDAKTASTKDLLASYKPNDFKLVDPDDIHVAPAKFMSKPIEVRNVQCFFADKDDYRCVASGGSPTAFFTSDVQPTSEKEKLENDCGSIKQVEKLKCRRSIHIIPTDSNEDTINAFQSRVVIKAGAMQLMAASSSSRRR